MPLDLERDVVELGAHLAERRRGVAEAAADGRLAIRVFFEAVEVVAALRSRRDAAVFDADVAFFAAGVERCAAERTTFGAARRADDSVEADLPRVAARQAVVAAALVLTHRRAGEVVDAFFAFVAAQTVPRALVLGLADAAVRARAVGERTAVDVGRELATGVDANETRTTVAHDLAGIAEAAAWLRAAIARSEEEEPDGRAKGEARHRRKNTVDADAPGSGTSTPLAFEGIPAPRSRRVKRVSMDVSGRSTEVTARSRSRSRAQSFAAIFAHESFKPMVRLRTNAPGLLVFVSTTK